MQKTCLECSEKIIGRADKKFCSDYCRNTYHNKINKDNRNLIRNINNRLRKNYRILEGLYPERKTRTAKVHLLDKGFDFEYLTNLYINRNGKIYYFVYDLGYMPLDNGFYMIIKRKC